MQHLLEFGAARQFFEAAPVFRTLGLGDAGASRIQIERALLAGTDVLAAAACAGLFVPSSCVVLRLPSNLTDDTSNSW